MSQTKAKQLNDPEGTIKSRAEALLSLLQELRHLRVEQQTAITPEVRALAGWKIDTLLASHVRTLNHQLGR